MLFFGFFLHFLNVLLLLYKKIKVIFHLRNEVCFPCFMKTVVRLGEFESRSVQTRDVVECLDLLEI
jgi:hypothetical protein